MSKLETFLAKYEKTSTIKTFTWVLGAFAKSICGNKKDLSSKLDQYLSENRDYEKDVEQFYISLNGKPPLSKRLMISNLKTFLIDNDVELSNKFWARLKQRNSNGNRAISLDEIPEKSQLKQIFTHLNAKGKALFMTLASSGMRSGEALQLKLEDLDLEVVPTKIKIRGETTKTNSSRFAFISSEATEALKEWLKVREESLQSIIKRTNARRKNKVNVDRIFPFEFANARFMWAEALRKAKLDKRDGTTNRLNFHIHVLRKFFRTQMATEIQVDIVEALMGHEGYLTQVYRKYSPKDLAKFYVRGEYTISIFGNTGDFTKVKAELEMEKNDLSIRNIAFQKWFIEVKQENEELKKKYDIMFANGKQMYDDLKIAIGRIEELENRLEYYEERPPRYEDELTNEEKLKKKDVQEERKEIKT